MFFNEIFAVSNKNSFDRRNFAAEEEAVSDAKTRKSQKTSSL
jgi:hypothetical protein